jgi:ParB family transcriptional regulator, chromosome partitioning protein
MTRKALGKGLGALLRDRETTVESDLREVEVDLLEPNPYQPRQVFAEDRLEDLARSIQSHGFVQPLLVRPHGGRYQIIAGERRWRAAQRLGLARVPVVLRSVSNERMMEDSLIENIQRENLNPIEEARAYHRLSHELGLTQDEVAHRTGKDRSTVANFLRLLKLPKELQQLVLEEKLSMGHARALLGVESAPEQRVLAERSLRNEWSVRQLEKTIQHIKKHPESKESLPVKVDPNVKAAIEKLQQVLSARVRIIEKGKKGGRIEIDYSSQEELQRLYEYFVREESQD